MYILLGLWTNEEEVTRSFRNYSPKDTASYPGNAEISQHRIELHEEETSGSVRT
jgi:hypothetical protein